MVQEMTAVPLEDAYTMLKGRLQGFVLGMMPSERRDPDLAHDVVHTAFANVCDRWEHYSPPTMEDARRLLTRVVYNAWLDTARSADYLRVEGEHDRSRQTARDKLDVEVLVERAETLQEQIVRLEREVSDRERKAIYAYVRSGGSSVAVARQIGTTTGGAKSLMTRVRARLGRNGNVPPPKRKEYLYAKRQTYSAEQDALIMSLPVKEVALLLNRSQDAITNRRVRLKERIKRDQLAGGVA